MHNSAPFSACRCVSKVLIALFSLPFADERCCNRSATAKARDVWKKKDLEAGAFTGGKFTAMIGVHDTLLLRLSPSHL